MKTTLYPFGIALALALNGCTPSTEAPATPVATGSPATTSQTAINSEVATVDLSDDRLVSNDVTGRDSATPVGSSPMGIQIQALEGNLAEQQMAGLALERASDAEVKQAARMLETDHETAETALRQAAGTTLPDGMELSSEHQEVMGRLQGLSGTEFDKAYVDAMVGNHEKKLAFYQKQSVEAPTPALRDYFTETSPVVQRHLEHCKELQASLL